MIRKYLGWSNFITDISVKAMDHEFLFTNKQAPIVDCLPLCRGAGYWSQARVMAFIYKYQQN